MVGFGKVNTISQIAAKIQIDKDPSIIIIDVREVHEYAAGHLKNAINIPLNEISIKVPELIKDLNQKIFVNCLSGSKSKTAAALIKAKGYKNVYDIGGVANWKYDLYM